MDKLIEYLIEQNSFPNSKKEPELWKYCIKLVEKINEKGRKNPKLKELYKNLKVIVQLSENLNHEWNHLLKFQSLNICNKCGNYANYNYPKWQGWGIYCENHKLNDMVRINSPPIKFKINICKDKLVEIKTQHKNIESPIDAYVTKEFVNGKRPLYREIDPNKLIWKPLFKIQSVKIN